MYSRTLLTHHCHYIYAYYAAAVLPDNTVCLHGRVRTIGSSWSGHCGSRKIQNFEYAAIL